MNDNPFASPTVELGESPPEAYLDASVGELRFAGFFRRLFAYIIDAIVAYVLSIVVGITLSLLLMTLGAIDSEFAGAAVVAMVMATMFFYFAGLESSIFQATVGKQLLGLRVVNSQGQRIGLLTSVVRQLGKVTILLYGIGAIPVFFRKDRRTFHDMIVRTYVVRR